MKKTVLIVMVFLLAIFSDGFSQKKKDRNKITADTIAVDSAEYELIIMDPGYEIWLATRPSKEFYSKEYYELKNRLYVAEWNQRYMTIRNNGMYESYIDYNATIDYGLDLNYKLYYYFRYFEETNNLKLLNSSR